MARDEIAVVQLLWELLNRKTGELGNVSFLPQKPAYNKDIVVEQPFERSTPEEQGISSEYIADMVRELRNCSAAHMHQLMIIRNKHVIYEGGFSPYPAGVWHVTYSMCKSVTNMAIGFLVDDGRLKLEDHLIDFIEPESLIDRVKMKDITIRNMLTMSTGVAFNETGAISGNDWVNGYFRSKVKFTPGSQFEYNSMNTYMLSAIVGKITGVTMFEFLKPRLFEPLGITQVFWEESPQGITKGGWGLFIRQEDAAKLGQLYMQKGIWNGKRIISEKWIEESTKLQIQPDKDDGYGYHIWMDVRPESFTYNGMLGQNVHCYPDIDTIVVTNAGNGEVFQGGRMTTIIRKYFGPDFHPADKLEPNPAAFHFLEVAKREAEGTIYRPDSIEGGGWSRASRRRKDNKKIQDTKSLLNKLNGVVYKMRDKGVGLFPLIMQVVHNNYTGGITKIRFRHDEQRLFIDFLEGQETHTIGMGFLRPEITHIDMNGEDYLTSVLGRFGTNEDGVIVLTLQIAYIEEATERQLKIYFPDKDHIELHWDEIPGNTMITDTLEMITMGSGNLSPFVDKLMENIPLNLLKRNITGTIQPTVKADRMTGEDADTGFVTSTAGIVG